MIIINTVLYKLLAFWRYVVSGEFQTRKFNIKLELLKKSWKVTESKTKIMFSLLKDLFDYNTKQKTGKMPCRDFLQVLMNDRSVISFTESVYLK